MEISYEGQAKSFVQYVIIFQRLLLDYTIRSKYMYQFHCPINNNMYLLSIFSLVNQRSSCQRNNKLPASQCFHSLSLQSLVIVSEAFFGCYNQRTLFWVQGIASCLLISSFPYVPPKKSLDIFLHLSKNMTLCFKLLWSRHGFVMWVISVCVWRSVAVIIYQNDTGHENHWQSETRDTCHEPNHSVIFHPY